ncbi:MAG: glycosyltransferase family 9 protein [Crocinitomicaceae bacterium]|nr:glycosyltransferase family 9 protein [Crocinitomicaceae bacterium]
MKILVVRFSSIGDVVLTTPVVRALKNKLDFPEIHYLTKKSFASILDGNTNVDRVITIEKSIDEVIGQLKIEKYDWVIDLHNNIRTASLKLKLRRPSKTFKKLNFRKWLLVKLKIDRMPDVHVVDRYFDAVKSLGVENDKREGEFAIAEYDYVDVNSKFNVNSKSYVSIAIGAQFATKRMPKDLLVQLINQIDNPVVLVGGAMDKELADEVLAEINRKDVFNACGHFNLKQSASIVAQSSKLVTNDTGMMHIASCLIIPVISVWGNTVPSLGMYPYYPTNSAMFSIHEVNGLDCRPCSKIGYQKCPKDHFKCMNDQSIPGILKGIN